jgi:predicted nucleic acid-binding Zn ribbon protein
MPELLNHRHCKNCDRAVPYDEELCSDECRAAWAALQKKRSRNVLLFYLALAFMIVILLLQLGGRLA